MHHHQQHYSFYPQQPLSGQTEAPYQDVSYRAKMPEPQHPCLHYRVNNSKVQPARHYLTPNCHSLRDLYFLSKSQREQASSNSLRQQPQRNCFVEASNSIYLQQQRQHQWSAEQSGALHVPVSHQLVYPDRCVVYRPAATEGGRCASISDDKRRPVNRPGILPHLRHRPVPQQTKLREPNQPPPLTSKCSRHATATLSGVSTAASLCSLSSSASSRRLQHDISFPSFRRPPCLSTAVLSCHPEVSTDHQLYRESVRQQEQQSGNTLNVVPPELQSLLTDNEAFSGQHAPESRKVVRKISETYRKRLDGTWIGLGVKEKTKRRNVGETQNQPLSDSSNQWREDLIERGTSQSAPEKLDEKDTDGNDKNEKGKDGNDKDGNDKNEKDKDEKDKDEKDKDEKDKDEKDKDGKDEDEKDKDGSCVPIFDHAAATTNGLIKSIPNCFHQSIPDNSIVNAFWKLKQGAAKMFNLTPPESSVGKCSVSSRGKTKIKRRCCDTEIDRTRGCQTARRPGHNNTRRNLCFKSTEIVPLSKTQQESHSALINNPTLSESMFDRSLDLPVLSSTSSSLKENPARLPLLNLSSVKKTMKKKTRGFNTARPVVFPECQEAIGDSDEETRVSTRLETEESGPDTLKQEFVLNPIPLKYGSMTERKCSGKYGNRGVEIFEPRNQDQKYQISLFKGKRVLRNRVDLLNADATTETRVEKNDKNHRDFSPLIQDTQLQRYKDWLIKRNRVPHGLFLNFDELEFKSTIVEGRKDASYSLWSADGPRCRLSLEEINNGTFCTVYKGIYKGKEVAVKCPLKHQIDNDPEMTNVRSIKELRLLARAANHLNILKLYGGLVLSKEEIWIVTEFIPGGDLYTKLYQSGMKESQHTLSAEQNREIPPDQRLKIMQQLSAALSFLHSLEPKIVHKDLKSNNILVDDRFDIRLCDFGDAEEIYSGEGIKYYTAVTWQYAPPEIILSKDPSHPERPCNESVDIWSLGCILLELCYRPTPFSSLLERVDPIHHHVALQNYLHKLMGGGGGGSLHHHHYRDYNCRFKEGQFFCSRLPHCLSVLIDWCLSFESFFRPTAKQVHNYLRQFHSNLLTELKELDEHRKRRNNKKQRFV